MSRDIGTDLTAEIDKPDLKPFMALHIDLPDPVRAFTGTGRFIIDGEEWIGAGGIGALDTVGEATDGSATGMKATLLQVPAEFREDIAQQAVKGALFEVYVGAFDETFQRVEAFKLIWKGRLDTYQVVDSGDTISVEVTGESRMRDQGRPSIKRMTDEWQQRHHPGDLFFQYVSQMAEIPVLWAKADQSGTGNYSGGSGGGGGARFLSVSL
jgi:hypothetical protein